jgi:lysophospholipase L1-like esterase
MSQIVDDLRQVAIEIKTETQVGGNTAARVGGAFERVADALEGTQQIEDMDAAVAAVQQAAAENEQTIQDIVNNLAVVQTTGQSTSAVMSQKAVTDEIEAINDVISVKNIIDIGGISTTNAKYINSSNQWVNGNVSATENIASINIPVSAGETYLIEAINYGAIYAFLKSNTTVGNPVDFSSSLQTRVVLSSGDKVKITIPSDTTLLYCYYGRYNPRTSTLTDDWRPQLTKISSFVVQETGQSTHAVMSQKAISDIIADAEIDVNTYDQNQKFINSSNEWQSGNLGTDAAYSTNMPVTAGETYLIEAINDGAIYAFLKSNTTIGNPVDFSSSLYGRVVMDKYEKKVITIPSDTTILYCYKYQKKISTGNIVSDWRPKLIKLSSIGIIKNTTPHSLLRNGLMMGDSITYGVYSYFNNSQRWNGVELDNSIAEYIGECTGTKCKNIGKRGTGYVADTRNIDNAWEIAQTTDYTHIDYVVMMYGVNDYIQGVPLGTIADNVEDTIAGNMIRTLNKIFTDNPLCKVICVGSYNTWGQVSQGGDYTSNVYYGDESTDYGLGYAINGHTLRDVLNTQKMVCEHYHIQFVCLADEGVVNNFNIKNTLVDGLHPTIEIRKVIAQEIAKHII